MKTRLPAMKLPVKEKSQQWPQFVCVISAGFLALGAGLHFGWPSPSIPKLLKNELHFPVTTEEISYITMIAPLGYLIGCPLSAYVLDVLGRKTSLLLLAIPQILAWLLIGTSTSVYMLYAGRIVAGIAEGSLFTVLPVYLCEIAEPKIRGVLGTTITAGLIMGILLINCYGSYMPITTTAFASIVVPVIFIATFFWMPESPYFYLIKGRSEEARQSLKWLRGMHDVENELTSLSSDVKRQISEPGKLKDLFTIKSNLKAFLISVGLRTVQQFTGISAFGVYTQVIFQQGGGTIGSAESAIIYMVAQTVVTCGGSILIDKFGRKRMIVASTTGTTVFLFVEGIYFYLQYMHYDLSSFTWVPITGMMMYIIVFGVGLGVGPNVMVGELFSASIKAKALCVMNIYFGICLSTSFKLFQWLDEMYGMHVPFFFFGVVSLHGIVFCYFCIPETKGKTLEEIQQILKGNKKCDSIDKDSPLQKIEVGEITRF